jgi:hypothetical protein
MGMDPKQERVLRDGTASAADQPRETDRESVRWQAENPPVPERPRPRRRTAAVAGTQVNLQSGTPVEQLSRAMGAEPVPEMGEAPDRRGNGNRPRVQEDEVEEVENAEEERGDAQPAETGEASRTLRARREHSKGDGNFPTPEPSPQLIDERPEDRTPRDLPKERDDRSAPKGNVTVGQPDRNPALETRDEYKPRRPRQATPPKRKTAAGRGRKRATPTRARAQAGRSAESRKAKPTPRKRSTATARKKKPAGRSNPQARTAAARGSRKPATKRSVRGGGPKTRSGNTRGGKR